MPSHPAKALANAIMPVELGVALESFAEWGARLSPCNLKDLLA